MHGILLISFNDDYNNNVWNTNWKSSYIHPDKPEDLRVLNEVICFLLFCGLMSISLLISSKYSKLESDRSRFQIYKDIKKEFKAFRVAESVDNMAIMDFFKVELVPDEAEDRKLFNFLFAKDKCQNLDRNPIDFLEFSDVNAEDKVETLLTKAVKMKRNSSALKKLMESEHIDVNKKDPCGKTPLACAIDCEDTQTVQMLLSHPKIRVNELSDFGDKEKPELTAPLLLAVQKKNCDIVEALLKHKYINANILPFGKDKFTPLTRATYLKNERMVRLLLNYKKVDVNKMDSRGWTPLRQACNRGDGYEHQYLFNWMWPDEDWPILDLIIQREDLKVKEPDLALCSHEALKNNLNLKMGEFKVCQMEQDYQV